MENVTYGICQLHDSDDSDDRSEGSVRRGADLRIKLELCYASGKELSSRAVVLHATEIVSEAGVRVTPKAFGDDNRGHDFRFVRYLGALGGYLFNVETEDLKPGTYRLQFVATGDPVLHLVTFRVRERDRDDD